MAFVTPTAEQLGLYLDLPEIRADRADLLLQQAVALAEAVVRPLLDRATAVVLSVAGRAYVNPQQVSYETIGPMSVQRPQGSGGLYLTKADKSALKITTHSAPTLIVAHRLMSTPAPLRGNSQRVTSTCIRKVSVFAARSTFAAKRVRSTALVNVAPE